MISPGSLKKLTCGFIIFISLSSFAQVHNFVNYSADEGFSDSRINALWQDSRGNLWIGTSGEGLARFDSHTFHWYREEDGLLSGFVNAICEDTSGSLWIGTDMGVFIYNGKKFRHFTPLSNEKINTIVRDHSGSMWLGTATQGVYKCDAQSAVPLKASLKTGIDGKINFLFADRNTNLWIGTTQGVVRYRPDDFSLYTPEQGLPVRQVSNVSEDAKGNLWFATDDGIISFDGKQFASSTVAMKGKNLNTLISDDKNNLWLGSDDGLLKFDGQLLRRYDDASRGQKKISILCSYKDHEGNLWFGTSQGLSKLGSERFTHYQDNDRMGKRVYSIVQAINGNIICGTSLGGTTVFDGEQYTLLNQREGFTSSVVQCFYYSADSSLWIGTQDDGVYKFAKSGMQHYTVDNELPIDNITGFTEDKNHHLWIVSADSGIAVVRSSNDSIHLIRRYTMGHGIPSNKINAIATDGTAIWIGTADTGAWKILNGQPETITNLTAVSGNTIHALLADSLGRVYIATSQGITIYEGNQSRNLTRNDGLSSNIIYSLTVDRQRNLWAGTERGVNRINLNELSSVPAVRNFGVQEGFRGVEVYRNSSCIDRKGNVWFGTINGLVRYNPQEDISSDAFPTVNLTGIKLFFEPIENTSYGDSITSWYPLPVKLSLPYNQNNLTFAFTGIYHRKPQAVKYKWMLEGFNKEWSPAVTEPQAIFSNLPPGSYTFKVIACNENNVWTTEPATFSFFISSPFWQRWWFVTALLLIVIGTVSAVFYFRLQRVKTKNKIIQEKLEMEKSILQLEQEAARLQMNPHFIFNCLNSIQGFIATNDPFQAKKYLAKFAKLMRLILENAREEFIPLENEMNILESYLELEKLSTSPPFDFSITLDPSIDASHIQIPPMMVQPFVENAIVHGLRKKENKGILSIHFVINGDVLLCTIRDNGIGRQRAAELNGMNRSQHTSRAIPITERRLEQYGAYLHVKAGVKIIDLKENDLATGTEVVVSTPFETY